MRKEISTLIYFPDGVPPLSARGVSVGGRARCLLRGFTVIEIIMVIVVMGILAVASIPRIEGLRYQIKLKAAVKKLVSDIRYVQSIAISRHTNSALVFDEPNNYYAAFFFNTSSSSWQALTDPLTRGALTVDYNSPGHYSGVDISALNFNGFSDELRFDWQGVPMDSGDNNLTATGRVTLSAGGLSRFVDVLPQTGKVEVNQ